MGITFVGSDDVYMLTSWVRFINRDTLASLQIIQSEPHPNAYNQGPGKTSSGAKESLSLYGLFHRFARTPQGKGVLKQMFLRPSVRSNVIQERHDFISTFLKSDNYDAMEKLIKSLRGIKNLRPVMIHLQKGISTGNAKFRGFKNVVWTTLLEVKTLTRVEVQTDAVSLHSILSISMRH